jgi:hypothetical protein
LLRPHVVLPWLLANESIVGGRPAGKRFHDRANIESFTDFLPAHDNSRAKPGMLTA